jgi:hypothetical protein
VYLRKITVEISTYYLQFCYPKGFLSSSSTGSIFPVAPRTFYTYELRIPTLLESLYSRKGLHCHLVSLSTLYGVNSFLVLLITTGLASQLSPYLRGFLREASITKYHTDLNRIYPNDVLILDHQYLGNFPVSML